MSFSIIYNLAVVISLLVVLYLLLRPVICGTIYFPTTPANIDIAMKLAAIGPGTQVVDLGSGDGRLLIACAERGAHAEGYEVNPFLVHSSRQAIRAKGLGHLAVVHAKSMWRADLSKFDVVFVYGIPHIMKGLEKKFTGELKPGTKIVSNVFRLPDWKPVAQEGSVYLYEVSGL